MFMNNVKVLIAKFIFMNGSLTDEVVGVKSTPTVSTFRTNKTNEVVRNLKVTRFRGKQF